MTERTDYSAGDSEPVALVTGASRGIGAATAARLAREGYRLVLVARTGDELQAVAADLPTTALCLPTDVTDPESVESMVASARKRFGRLDAVVVNAGTGERADVSLTDLTLAEYQSVRATNIDGAFYTTRSVLEPLCETEGTLVFVGSYKGKYPSTSTPVYAASKWWLRGFAKSVAGQIGPDGVGVSLVNPSGVPTSFGKEHRGSTNAERLDPTVEISAEDVAEVIFSIIAQEPPGAITEVDVFRKDIFERF